MRGKHIIRRSFVATLGIGFLSGVIAYGQAEMKNANKPIIGAWLHTGGPAGVWEKYYANPWPIKMIVNDAAKQGLTELAWFVQEGRGGAFYYPTTVEYAKTDPSMQSQIRDYLEELLQEADTYDIKIWLNFTTPVGKYPGAAFEGLNHPAMIRLYCDVIEEIAKKYGHHRSLFGFMPHELDCTEAVDQHAEEKDAFSTFCRDRFGEPYAGAGLPIEVNPHDKWWRRFFLYRIRSVNTFTEATAKIAARHGLKTMFCAYTPESFPSDSWRWGYDPVGLERICDVLWIRTLREGEKPYHNLRAIRADFAIAYAGNNMAQNFAYAFHGNPLFYFEFRLPNYIEAMRKHYSAYKKFTDKYGDVYTGYKGCSEKEMALFLGQENLKKWCNLLGAWQGGTSPAKVAMAISSIPFVMKYPSSPGVAFAKNVEGFMQDMTHHVDLDGIMLGSQFALNPAKLSQYRLIILPEDMGEGLSAGMVASLKEYCRQGGKILVIATAITESREDLTLPKDLTGDFCGVDIEKRNVGAYVQPKCEALILPAAKQWASSIKKISVKKGNILATDAISGSPLLVQNGSVYFSTIGYAPESKDYFGALICSIGKAPVTLDKSSGIRLVESVQKDNMLCLSFFDRGQARLQVDLRALTITNEQVQVKNILTGVILNEVAAPALKSGIPVGIRHVNEPLVLAIGAANQLAGFKGIFPAGEDFSGLAKKAVEENPEVPIMVSNKPGIKVGIYHAGDSAGSLLSALGKQDGLNAFLLPRLDVEALGACHVLVLPQTLKGDFVKKAQTQIQDWVKNGGGILLTHTQVGYSGTILFPTIGQGQAKVKFDTIKNPHLVRIMTKHAVTKDMDLGAFFTPGFQFDHITIHPGADGIAIVVDDKEDPVLVAGVYGKGRVVLNGMLPGFAGDCTDAGGMEKEPSGDELTILLNSIRWLGENP